MAADNIAVPAAPKPPMSTPSGASVRPSVDDGRRLAPDLSSYRAAVDELHSRLTPEATAVAPELSAQLKEELAAPGLQPVLRTVPGGLPTLHRELATELNGFRHGSPSSAKDPSALVRIFLLTQIDRMWWSDVAPFADTAAVADDAELIDLCEHRRDGSLLFQFKMESHGLPGRIRNWAVHRYMPRREPHTSGLSARHVRPEMVGVLNAIAVDLAAAAPAGTPRMWVTSALRTVDHQHHLRDLGYAALLPSAHCAGFAADIAMTWMARFGADQALADVLLHYQDRGIANVIDEGPSWHLCLHPAARDDMRRRFSDSMKGS